MSRGEPLIRQWNLLKTIQANYFGIAADELAQQGRVRACTHQRGPDNRSGRSGIPARRFLSTHTEGRMSGKHARPTLTVNPRGRKKTFSRALIFVRFIVNIIGDDASGSRGL